MRLRPTFFSHLLSKINYLAFQRSVSLFITSNFEYFPFLYNCEFMRMISHWQLLQILISGCTIISNPIKNIFSLLLTCIFRYGTLLSRKEYIWSLPKAKGTRFSLKSFFPTSIPALLKFTTKYRKSCLLSTAYQPRLKVTIKFINKYKAGQKFTRFFFEDLGSYTAYISYSKAWKMSHDSFLLLSYDIMPPRLEM